MELDLSQNESDTSDSLFQQRVDFSDFHTAIQKVSEEIKKVIVGQQNMIDLMLTALLSDGHILLEGVPGVAKTLSAKLLAKTLSINFSRIQFTPDLMPSDVLGTTVFNAQQGDFEFRKGPLFAQVILIDEINRAPAKTQSALFEAMEERQITIDGSTYPLESPFLVIATQNPIEQEGTYRLPEAQLDRFLFNIQVTYPNPDEEVQILLNAHQRKGQHNLDQIQSILTSQEILEAQQTVQGVHMEEKLIKYIVSFVQQTRQHKDIFLGASPRASLNIMTGAKAFAAMSGRDFVIPEDIQQVAIPVLQHRLVLTPEKEMEGGTARDTVKRLIQQEEIPR